MLNKVWEFVNRAGAHVAAAIVAVICVFILIEVAARYLFNNPTDWATGMTEYMLLYVVFLPVGWALLKNRHIMIDLVLARQPPRRRLVSDAVIYVICAIICGVMFWFSMTNTVYAFQSHHLIIREVIIPKWPIMVGMLVGWAYLTLGFARGAWLRFKTLASRNGSVSGST